MSDRATTLYHQLWAGKYAALHAALVQDEQTRRAEDFVDGARQVGPWSLRSLTAHDLLLCDGYECPLVCGEEAALAATPEQLWWFAWLLSEERAQAAPADTLRVRARFIDAARDRHFPRRPAPWWRRAWAPRQAEPAPVFFTDLAAVVDFAQRHFADSACPKKINPATGQPTPIRETGVNWLAGLVVAIACETGWTEAQILNLPLGRLWQYLRVLEQRANGSSADYSRSNRLRSQCLAEVNVILASERAP